MQMQVTHFAQQYLLIQGYSILTLSDIADVCVILVFNVLSSLDPEQCCVDKHLCQMQTFTLYSLICSFNPLSEVTIWYEKQFQKKRKIKLAF